MYCKIVSSASVPCWIRLWFCVELYVHRFQIHAHVALETVGMNLSTTIMLKQVGDINLMGA